MSTLTNESQEVYTVLRYDLGGGEFEVADYLYEEDAIVRAQEEIGRYIAETGTYCYCKIERRVVPIYK